MRFVILAHIDDATALQVYTALKARHGSAPIKLVSSEQLAGAPHWTHRLHNSGVTTELLLSDGTLLASRGVGIVLNRLRYVTMPHFAGASEEDRNYAIMEMQALWLSWLASLPCPVVNQVTSVNAGIRERSHGEWLHLAGRAGLLTQGYHVTTSMRHFPLPPYVPHSRLPALDGHGLATYQRMRAPMLGDQPAFFLEAVSKQRQSVLVAGNRIIGSQGTEYAEQLGHLRALSGCDLFRVVFARSAGSAEEDGARGRWKVCGIDAFPHALTAQELAAIVDLLEAMQAKTEISR
jgi:hypothetical protein